MTTEICTLSPQYARHIGLRPLRAVGAALATAALVATLASCSSSKSHATSSTTKASTGSSAPDPSLTSLVPADIRQRGYITMATNVASGPPCEFNSSADSTQMIGLDVDLWNAVAAKLGLTVKATSIDFASIIPSVQAGRYDMGMECFRDTLAREQQVDFVDQFYSDIGFQVAANNPHKVSSDPVSVCGLKMVLQTGLSSVPLVASILNPACSAAGKPPVSLTELPSGADVLLALNSGRADVTINGVALVGYLINKLHGPYKIFTVSAFARAYTGPVFPKTSTALRDAWLKASQAIVADGQYATILHNWGADTLNLDSPGINLASARPLPSAATGTSPSPSPSPSPSK